MNPKCSKELLSELIQMSLRDYTNARTEDASSWRTGFHQGRLMAYQFALEVMGANHPQPSLTRVKILPMKRIILTALLGLLAVQAHAYDFSADLFNDPVMHDSQTANDCVKELTKIYPRLILLARQQTFHITSGGMGGIYMKITYAIDMGYGFQRGPFNGCYQITYDQPTNTIHQSFFNLDTGENPFRH